MSEKVTKSKALCYVVRGGMLLVHRHVDFPWEEVGVQVPAGSIRQGEAPEAAALREAREETGLQDFKIVRKLGVTTYDMGPYRAEIQERHVFHLELAEPTPERCQARRTTTASRSRPGSSASGSRWRARTCSSPGRARCSGSWRHDPHPFASTRTGRQPMHSTLARHGTIDELYRSLAANDPKAA
ncbi:NUDIX hydrolase [Streptomyces sp. cmx-4-25]|uniref:NUDIX hydrolase n=1 Tax=Streptomyces sp. cmx-4-25 TaxID=2790933 RepID=UPI00397FEB64